MEGSDRFPFDNIPQVWMNVYDKLDPKDKLAFAGASSVWHDWVEPKRTESLVSEVAPYLIEHGHPVNSRRGLQARELCQSWKKGIDQENQTHGSNTSLYFEIAADEGLHLWHPSCRSRLYRNCFHFAEDAQEFIQEMSKHTGNPFPGRSISLACHLDFQIEHEDLNEEWRDYWRSIILLLEKFGSHLHFASILFDDHDELELGTLESQGYLRECLLRLPNLKEVNISYECGSLFLDDEGESPFLEDQIRQFYRLNPLPQLEHLETVALDFTSLATVGEVLNSCCDQATIKRLSVRPIVTQHPERLALCEAVYRFVNLEVLQASILLLDLESFARLERRPPLRELDLTFQGAPYIEDVFMLLQVFGETLIHFRSNSRMRSRNDIVNGELFTCNLPHLKKIFFPEYWGTAEFLFQFKSLTHVEIWRTRDTYWRFPLFQERLEDASIWTLMPSLQWLSLGNRATVYERKLMEQQRDVLEQRNEVLEQRNEVLEQRLVVLEQPRLDSIDNHDTMGLQERTWSQKCRLVLVEVLSSVLTDFFHGLLF